ncbi:MAG: single-stranded DNA-binding protein [Ardenticatenaceae bacterium]|nr:single-stranded DNA-binding protein [Anaerolineales bacterium]MCB8985139.1 single-stranded DNA-binding protein [Ardenticatenaceae bacterium]MCB8986682.1 single-stranded DNA-binding protein [Ardenticatenaceae bacterium]
MNKGLNKVLLIGQVEGLVDVRRMPNGRPVAAFTLAVPRTWTSAEGEYFEETEWFNIVAWGSLADVCEKWLTSESQVYLEGRLQTRSWEDNTGRKHFRTEVIAQEIITLSDFE